MNEVKERSVVTLNETNNGKVLELGLAGKVTQDDYERFVPVVDRLVQKHGKIRMLLDIHDLHGVTAGGLWEDLKFDAKHFSDIERVAVVGETKWQQAVAVLCKPFTSAQVRYFDRAAIDQARAWLGAPSM